MGFQIDSFMVGVGINSLNLKLKRVPFIKWVCGGYERFDDGD